MDELENLNNIEENFSGKKVNEGKKNNVEILNDRLKEVLSGFNALKGCGVDEEILEIYLKEKTKLSRKKIKEMLHHTEEFYKKLVRKTIVENLPGGK